MSKLTEIRCPLSKLLVPSTEGTSEHIFHERDGKYYVIFPRTDGKQARKCLDTYDREEALKRRDDLFNYLLNKGVPRKTYLRDSSPQVRIKCNEDLYIYRQPKFFVRFKTIRIGTADTIEEARELRDAWFRKKGRKYIEK